MPTPDRVDDDEILVRHIPGGTTWQVPGPRITSRNFRPRSVGEGVSVSRTAITSAEQLMARLADARSGYLTRYRLSDLLPNDAPGDYMI